MPEGFSEDGYIIDQDRFAAYPYRTMASSVNGCGWIAAYNLRRSLGQDVDFDAVRAEMDSMFTVRIPGPTTMDVMVRYLGKYCQPLLLTAGHERVLSAALESRAGVLRYREGTVPHFVPFVPREDGLYRFFNVADGLEDCCFTMETFIKNRCSRAPLRSITVPRRTAQQLSETQ